MKLVHGLIFGLGLGGLSAIVLGIADKHVAPLLVISLLLLAVEGKSFIGGKSDNTSKA